MNVKTIEINEDVFSDNNKTAEETRRKLRDKGCYFMNIMSSPGSGKTTLLTKLIPLLMKKYKIGEMDVDIESDLDSARVAKETGIPSLQIHNGGLCHIDADMTKRALMEYNTECLDLLILENIGNLVCPAEFDTGAHKNYMILSIPEGDDKPLKYPLMFTVSDVIIFSKIDTLPYFNFDINLAKERILSLNPKAIFFTTSAKTMEGMDLLAKHIEEEIEQLKKNKKGI